MDATTPPAVPASEPPPGPPPAPAPGDPAPTAGRVRAPAAPAGSGPAAPPGPPAADGTVRSAAPDPGDTTPGGARPGPEGPLSAPGRPGAAPEWFRPSGDPRTLPAPTPPLWRRLAAPLGTIAAVGAAFAYVGTVDPNEPGHYPTCPLLRFTGIYCPGCGGLRSAHAFVHGDLGTAFGANALAVVGYGVFFALWVLWTVRAVRGVPGATWRIAVRPFWWWVTGAVVLVFSVLRNLPLGSAIAP